MFLFLYAEGMREREEPGMVALELSFSSSLGKMMNNSQTTRHLPIIFLTWC